MAINPEDVKIYEPQRLTDESDGGGRATGNVVEDGVVNNLFADISRVDRTVGDVSLRKFFVGVDTDNQDMYLGVHSIISEAPEDENVSVLLFDAGDEGDERSDAQNRVESYVVPGAAAPWDLQGNQYAGQRAVVGFQIKEARVPEVGEVYLLRDEDAGNEQYIRIADIEHEMMPYTVLIGGAYQTFERRQLNITLTSTLKTDFPGGDVTPAGPAGPRADILTTKVADAARYWGVSESTEDVSVGDVGVNVASIYKSIVPSARAEKAILDQVAGYDRLSLITASSGRVSQGVEFVAINEKEILAYLPRAIEPGSLRFTWARGPVVYSDNGDGTMSVVSGSPQVAISVDYKEGIIRGESLGMTFTVGNYYGWITVYPNSRRPSSCSYLPAVKASGRALSAADPVTLQNRALSIVKSFADAKPAPGTFSLAYRALGSWYELVDRGSGILSGAGAGSIDFMTGTVNATLEALPDPDSHLVWTYLPNESGDTSKIDSIDTHIVGRCRVSIPENAVPGSVVINYTDINNNVRSLSDSGNAGVLTGHGTGEIDYGSLTAVFSPSFGAHKNNFSVEVVVQSSAAETSAIPMSSYSGGVLSGTLPDAPIRPGSVAVTALVNETSARTGVTVTREIVISDDGSGGWSAGHAGTIDYSSGVFNVDVVRETTFTRNQYGWVDSPSGRRWGVTSVTTVSSSVPAGDAVVRYQSSSSPAASEAPVPAECEFVYQLPIGGGQLRPGSFFAAIGPSHNYQATRVIDRDGILYGGHSYYSGAATACGSVNYETGEVVFDSYPGRDDLMQKMWVLAGVTATGKPQVDHVSFRTPGAPLNPTSLVVTFTDAEGNLINETADQSGIISGASIQGTVDVTTGLVDLSFTDGTNPVYVWGSTGRYSAVMIRSLPLDADLIGLDPVRLPSDGRVPIYREGDVCVIHHKAEAAVSPSANLVVNTGRPNIANAWVEDADGGKLNPTQYTVDKAAGTLTFADPLALEDIAGNALTAPYKVLNRIEHMTMINGVDVTGHLSFIAPSGHDFPAGETLVSSAKVWGDINSRYFNFFKQRTWNSGSPNWTDERIGDDTTASYNEIDNPIEIANRGAITEKWAIVFTGSTTFQVVGSELGIIATGNTSTDLMPVNLNTGFPYFIVRAAGWGTGWAAGNAVRFDTEGCLAPGWICRTVMSGQGTIENDKFDLQIRGDAE